MFFDEADELLVGRPERLADADRVLDHLRNRRIPITALAVVENTIASDHQEVRVATGERGGNDHLLASRTGAVAVGEIGLRQARERGVLAGIGHRDAEIAAASIKIERARLEDRLALTGVEVLEGNEVHEELLQVAAETDELVHGRDRVRLRFERLVLGDEAGDGFLRLARQNFAAALEAELLASGSGFASGPRFVSAELGRKRRPVRFRERRLVAENRLDGRRAQGSHCSGPGGVQRILERKRLAGLDAREREACDFGGGDGQILRREREVFGLLPVQRRERALIKCRQPTAREVIVHLRLHRLERRCGCLGLVAQREDGRRVRLSLLPPIRKRRRLREELVHLALRDAGPAAAVRLAAEARDDVGDDRLRRIIRRGFSGHDAVAVKLRLGENLRGVACVFQRDRRGVLLAEVCENLFGGREELLAFRRRVVDGTELNRAGAAQQIIRVLHHRAGPLDRRDDLRRANASVLVRVDQVERLRVELDAAGRAAQRGPQLLIELVEIREIGSRCEVNLLEAAGAEKAPGV